jgi:hypothetical protein
VERLIAEHGADTKLPDLLVALANCDKVGSVSISGRCRARAIHKELSHQLPHEREIAGGQRVQEFEASSSFFFIAGLCGPRIARSLLRTCQPDEALANRVLLPRHWVQSADFLPPEGRATFAR